jgi:hypothetical protein
MATKYHLGERTHDLWNWENPDKPIMDSTWMPWGIVVVDKAPDGTWSAPITSQLVGGE